MYIGVYWQNSISTLNYSVTKVQIIILILTVFNQLFLNNNTICTFLMLRIVKNGNQNAINGHSLRG